MRYRGVSVAATIAALLVSLLATTGSGQSAAGAERRFTPGSAGAGDPYFPLDGNGGYDVKHYDVDVSYNPTSEHLSGTATIAAQATQNLSRFNFDFDGLHVQSIRVAGHPATWTRQSGELVVTPSHGIVSGHGFTTVVTYQGTPRDSRIPGSAPWASCVPTTARSWSANRTLRRSGSRPTTTPQTRPPSPSTSPCPTGLQAISNGRLASASHPERLDHVELDRHRADGYLPCDRLPSATSTSVTIGPTAWVSGMRSTLSWTRLTTPRAEDRVPLCLVRPDPRTGCVVQALGAQDRGPGRGRPALLLGQP